MGSEPEPADAILELILRLEEEASVARVKLRESLRRLGFDPEMTSAQLTDPESSPKRLVASQRTLSPL